MTVPHEVDVYVRFCETDALGHVNNTSHFLYFEEARTKFFKEIHSNGNNSMAFIIANVNCNYINEAFAGETLKVATFIKKIGTKSFTLSQTLQNKEDNKMIAEAETTIVCMDFSTKKTMKIPTLLFNNLQTHSNRQIKV